MEPSRKVARNIAIAGVLFTAIALPTIALAHPGRCCGGSIPILGSAALSTTRAFSRRWFPMEYRAAGKERAGDREKIIEAGGGVRTFVGIGFSNQAKATNAIRNGNRLRFAPVAP
jgi:hypothetical protein